MHRCADDNSLHLKCKQKRGQQSLNTECHCQVLHDNLLESQEGRAAGQYHSLGNVGSRIKHTDAILKACKANIYSGLLSVQGPGA